MDWALCIICQQKTLEPLKCPLNVEGSGAGDKIMPYEAFATNVTEFRKLDQLPVQLKLDSNINVDELVANEAKWHKSCHLKFNLSKLQRARKRSLVTSETEGTSNISKRSRHHRQLLHKSKCIFCAKEDGHLHEFMTSDANDHVNKMAKELQDTELLTRIEGGADLIAIEAKYHFSCLTQFRNRYRSFLRKSQCSDCDPEASKIEARAFAELVCHIEDSVESGEFCFRLSSLRKLYQDRLCDLGITKEINTVRFKEKVMQYFPDAKEQKEGKYLLLVFEHGLQQMLRISLNHSDHQENAIILMKAARILRDEIIENSGFTFDGSFPHGCQQESVPTNLMLLVSMLLKGSDFVSQESQACLTIAQTILFNFKKVATTKGSSSSISRHNLKYEPPLPIYVGLNLHTKTRSKKLITEMHDLGFSISYDRVIQLENQLASAVCNDIAAKNVVCPSQLRKGLFTVGALDNLDHNPSSTTAKASFHGTGISLFQAPTTFKTGTPQKKITLSSSNSNRLLLPDHFTVVPAVAMKKESVEVPTVIPFTVSGHLQAAQAQEKCWLEHAINIIEKEHEDGSVIAWSAYHASLHDPSDSIQPALTQLLPLFYEKAASAAMVKHGMDVTRKAIQYLNPEQIPVLALDAPLYALRKTRPVEMARYLQ